MQSLADLRVGEVGGQQREQAQLGRRERRCPQGHASHHVDFGSQLGGLVGQHAEVGSLLEDVVDLYEDVADRAGGGDRYLVAALQEHVLAGQGGRVVQGRGPVAALGRPLDALGHRHHQAMVVLHLPTARVRDCPG